MTIITDHSAVKPVLEAPNPTGKHARWWTRVHGSGIRSVHITYRPGRDNKSADALSRSPVAPALSCGIGQDEVQVSAVAIVAAIDSEIGRLCPLIKTCPHFWNYHLQRRTERWTMEESRRRILYLTCEQLPDDPE